MSRVVVEQGNVFLLFPIPGGENRVRIASYGSEARAQLCASTLEEWISDAPTTPPASLRDFELKEEIFLLEAQRDAARAQLAALGHDTTWMLPGDAAREQWRAAAAQRRREFDREERERNDKSRGDA